MTPTIEEQIRAYVSGSVITQEAGRPVDRAVPANRYSSDLVARGALAVGLVVFLLAVGLASFLSSTGTGTNPSAPAVTSPPPSSAQTSLAPGWAPITEPSATDPGILVSGYLAPGYLLDPSNPLPVPVYSVPGGPVIGYLFPLAGVVDIATYESGGFDAAAARIARWGCDPLDRSDVNALMECDARIADQVGKGSN